jgi:ribokinase
MPVPGETVKGFSFKMGPGGKGSNQAVAAHRAGCDVTFATKVGNDVFGKVALDLYKQENMNTDYIFIDNEKETGTALIMVDEKTGQNQILIVSGACGNITGKEIEKTEKLIEESDIILLQLEINMDAIERAIDIAYKKKKMIVLNTAPAPAEPLPTGLLRKIDIVTPNEIEAGILTGVEIKGEKDAKEAAKILMGRGVKNAVITLGSSGVFVAAPETGEFIKAVSVKAIDTTGAGDAFSGAFAAALSEGKSLAEAARFGNVAGALSVTKIGTARAMPYREEIDRFIAENNVRV